MEIYFKNYDNSHSCIKFYSPNGKKVTLEAISPEPVMGMYFRVARVTTNGTSITFETGVQAFITGPNACNFLQLTTAIAIVRVVGYKY